VAEGRATSLLPEKPGFQSNLDVLLKPSGIIFTSARRRMTIALGILADDGVVLAADTEESTGYLKNETTKILNVLGGKDVLKGSAVISGAGDSGYVSAAMVGLADVFLDNKTLHSKELQEAFESYLRESYKDHIIPFSSYPQGERPAIEMIIAHNRDGAQRLLISEKSVVLKKHPYAAIGVGGIFAEIMLNRLWRFAEAKMTQVLAAYVVFMVKETIQGCGKYTQISTLHRPKLQGSEMIAADPVITFLRYEDIERLENQFRTKWQQAEQENFWNLIKQTVEEATPT
jgi:hypothetical protein